MAETIFETYKLTTEDIRNANTYVPTIDKMAFIRVVAEKCFDTLDITTNKDNTNENRSLPSCYKVNTDKQSRYLMGALVKLYLNKDFESESEEDIWLMSVPEYDRYAGGHIFEQLNRMKGNGEIRDKCYDIIADYSELKYRLTSDIKGLLNAMNDSATRILAYIEAASSPAEMQKAMEAMQENQNILDEYLNHREENLEKAIEEAKEDNNDGDEEQEL